MGSTTAHLGRLSITSYGVFRIVLGLILLSAAALKAHQLATEPVVETGLLTSRWFLVCVVEFELFFGLWLLAGVLPTVSWVVAIAWFTCFGAVSLEKGLSGEVSCGCFGKVAVDPWHALGLDTAAVTALLCFRPQRRRLALDSPPASVQLRVAAVITLWLVGGGTIAWGAIKLGSTLAGDNGVIRRGGLVILEPERWVGRQFPLLRGTGLGAKLVEGNWTVVLYHRDCEACMDAIVRCEEALRAGRSGCLALVEIPGAAAVKREFESVLPRGEYIAGGLDKSVAWFVETPVVIRLREGAVVGVTGPSHFAGKVTRNSDADG